MDHNFDSLDYYYFSVGDDIFRSEVVTSNEFNNGTLLFSKGSYGQLNSFFTLIHLNKDDEIINHTQYSIEGSLFSSFSFEQAELFVLKNNQVLLVTRIDNGKKILFMRFDGDLELMENRIYENVFLDEPFGTERTSYKILDNNSSLLIDDGILLASHVDERKQDKLYFHHFPLDSNLLQCDQVYLEVKKDTLPILKPRTEPLITAVSIEVVLEDINLNIRKSIVNIGKAECISSYLLEDYYFKAIDSICLDQLTIRYEMDICRNEINLQDTLSLSLYEQSPLEYSVESQSTYQILFEEKQKCKNIIIEEPANDHYFLLNAKGNFPSPFTLEKTFFDAHQKMEYNYNNNMIFIEGDNCLDTSISNTNRVVRELTIFPNPTDNSFIVSSESEKIRNVEILSITGNSIYQLDPVQLSDNISITTNLAAGMYILMAQFEDGIFGVKKLIITK